MSVQSEITRLATNVSNSFTAVREAGVTVAANTNSDELATAIRQIPDAVREEINVILDEINGVVI